MEVLKGRLISFLLGAAVTVFIFYFAENIPLENKGSVEGGIKVEGGAYSRPDKALYSVEKREVYGHHQIAEKAAFPEGADREVDCHLSELAQDSALLESAEIIAKEAKQYHERAEKIKRYSQYKRDLEKEFNNEQRNAEWADAQERKIQRSIFETDDVGTFVAESIACKSSQCKLTFGTYEDGDSQQITSGLTSVFSGEKNLSLSVSESFEKNQTFYYVSWGKHR